MQVKLNASLATELRTYQAGDVVTLPDSDAISLIKRGMASPVRAEHVDLAVQPPAETTDIKRGPGRPRKNPIAAD